jgi:hypothetical protein
MSTVNEVTMHVLRFCLSMMIALIRVSLGSRVSLVLRGSRGSRRDKAA